MIEQYRLSISALLSAPISTNTARALMFCGYSVEAAAECVKARRKGK